MGTVPGKSPSSLPANPNLLLAVRVCGLLSVVLVGGYVPVLAGGYSGRNWGPILLTTSGFIAPYLIVLWLLREKATKAGLKLVGLTGTFVFFVTGLSALSAVSLGDAFPVALMLVQGWTSGFIAAYLIALWVFPEKPTKAGLWFAAVTGTCVSFLAGLFALFKLGAGVLGAALCVGLLLTQGVMVGSATRLAHRMAQEAREAKPLWRAPSPALVVVGYGILLAFFIPNNIVEHMPPAAVGVAALRTINTATFTYASAYGNNLAPTLTVLAPPKDGKANCNAAGLIDERLASGRRAGYVFIYSPGPAVEKPPSAGCPRGVKSYTVIARPLKYKDALGPPSLFTDETGVIRITSEDRPASAQDPPVE